jgi:hypothetical protein
MDLPDIRNSTVSIQLVSLQKREILGLKPIADGWNGLQIPFPFN